MYVIIEIALHNKKTSKVAHAQPDSNSRDLAHVSKFSNQLFFSTMA